MKTTKEINRSYLIKVYQKGILNVLVGVRGLIKLVGEERAEKYIDRAFRSMADKTPCKVYGTGMIVTFYTH